MKIVSLQEFIRMPNGTVYANFSPEIPRISMAYIDTLQIKLETWHNDEKEPIDWIYFEPHDPRSIDGRLCGARDGMFDEDQKFLIYEKADLELIAKTILTAGEVYNKPDTL